MNDIISPFDRPLTLISVSNIVYFTLKYFLEPELFIFYEACDAVLAVLDAKDALLYYNTSLTEENNKDTVTIHGWGVHHGKMVQEIFVVAYIE